MYSVLLIAILGSMNGQPVFHKLEAKADPKLYRATAKYIAFSDPSPVQALASKQDSTEAKQAHAEFVRGNDELLLDPSLKATAPWLYERAPILSYNSDELVSLLVRTKMYSGGAHESFTARSANFGLVNGEPTRLLLKDVLEGPNLSSSVAAILEPRILEQRRKRWEDAPEVEPLSEEALERWIVSPAGITWVFEPYLVASFAEGEFVIKVPWADIQHLVKKGGPLARFVPPRSGH